MMKAAAMRPLSQSPLPPNNMLQINQFVEQVSHWITFQHRKLLAMSLSPLNLQNPGCTHATV